TAATEHRVLPVRLAEAWPGRGRAGSTEPRYHRRRPGHGPRFPVLDPAPRAGSPEAVFRKLANDGIGRGRSPRAGAGGGRPVGEPAELLKRVGAGKGNSFGGSRILLAPRFIAATMRSTAAEARSSPKEYPP